MVNSCIHHDHPHPSHQEHLYVYILFEFKFVQVAENFNEAIVHDIHSFVVVVYIAENSFKAIAIKLLIEDLLISMVIKNAV